MSYCVAKEKQISRGKWRFDKTGHYCSVALSKSSVLLLIYYKFKTNQFIAKSQLLHMGCPLTRECKQKKNPIFIFKSVCFRLPEGVRLWECVNIEFDWEVKRGFEKVSVGRTVRLQECPSEES